MKVIRTLSQLPFYLSAKHVQAIEVVSMANVSMGQLGIEDTKRRTGAQKTAAHEYLFLLIIQ